IRRDPRTLDSIARALDRWELPRDRQPGQDGTMQSFATLRPVFPELRAYLQGRVAASLGRWDALDRAEARLQALNGPPDARALRDDLVLSLRALRAMAHGDSADAAALLGHAKVETKVELLNSSWFYSQSVEQFERARLAAWKGQRDVAI